ncbi:MAG: AAA domain-containing protein [Gammaproteobacteria bacterium]|nr:AAA domain-containing protein [Gammaproteobacteria bacterium]
MKLKDIQAEIKFDLWVKPFSDKLIEEGIGQISHTRNRNTYNLFINKTLCKVSLRDSRCSIDLDFHLKRGCANLVEVTQITKDGSAQIVIVFFNGAIVEMDAVEIGIDDHIETTVKESGVRFKDIEALGKHLTQIFLIKSNGDEFFLMLSGKSADNDFDFSEDDDVIIEEKHRAFSLYGERIRIPVEKKLLSRIDEIFHATKIIFKDKQQANGALRLVRGKLTFSSLPERIKAIASGVISQLTKEKGSYLKQWDKYGAVEGDLLLNKAKYVGKIAYSRTEKTNKGVKFFIGNGIEDQIKHLSEDDALEITQEEPTYLKDLGLSWDDYSKHLEEEFNNNKKHKIVFAPITKLSTDSIELKLDVIPKNEDDNLFLMLSINGDKIQIERRMKARSAVLEGRSANPLLGLIIEENGELPEVQRTTKFKPLTPFVKNKIFEYDPTPKQREAIDIALNTPDIALIQGPPGTGKTTVVTAILERLNEEFDKTNSIRGQILVSGYQHDAVENIVSRLSVNALPAVKFGTRSTGSEFTEDAVTKKLYQWCQDIADKIRNKNPQIAKSEEQRQLSELFRLYAISPSQSNTTSLLCGILNLPRDTVTKSSIVEAQEILNSLKTITSQVDHRDIRLIRALRVSEQGFKDDGASSALNLLFSYEQGGRKFEKEQQKLLDQASHWQEEKPLSFLFELKKLKRELLQKYLPSPEYKVQKPREDILALVEKVSIELKKSLSFENKRDAVLAEFLHELEDNPDGVREAVEDYNFVFAATTQQSEGSAIRRAKKKYKQDEFVRYDTVVVDEAARVSPRDLLIPMSQAEKRIILVGDHRQLPHLIDDEVASALENSDAKEGVETDFVKKSMFEYLFKRLKKLEQKDRIKRTVTLDSQYRTHPLLGEFASQNFYDQYGEAYRSPLPAELFEQSLNGITNKAAIWLDVKNEKGREEKKGFSRKRTAEASAIARQLSEWIKSDEGKTLSFGVISFYKAQVYEVFNALKQFEVTEEAQDRSWQIKDEYRFLENGEERLRLGTVDSFQGMEFDIVFLSVVRTQDLQRLTSWISKEEDYQRIKQGVFGHLMSENRLCVSMSRQKKALIVAGDSNLFTSQIAIDAVPALKNYFNLCQSDGVIL